MKSLEVPMREQVVDRTSLLPTMPWVDWFLRLTTRVLTQGVWSDVPFNAANFHASGAMVWTVDPADVVTYAYSVVGDTLFVSAYLNTTSISGTLGTQLFLALPSGFTAAKVVQTTAVAFDNGAAVMTFTRIGAFGTKPFQQIEIGRFDLAPWSASVNNTYIRVDMRIPLV